MKQARGKGGLFEGSTGSDKQIRRQLKIKEGFKKHNFHEWGEAVLRAVAIGDEDALRAALQVWLRQRPLQLATDKGPGRWRNARHNQRRQRRRCAGQAYAHHG